MENTKSDNIEDLKIQLEQVKKNKKYFIDKRKYEEAIKERNAEIILVNRIEEIEPNFFKSKYDSIEFWEQYGALDKIPEYLKNEFVKHFSEAYKIIGNDKGVYLFNGKQECIKSEQTRTALIPITKRILTNIYGITDEYYKNHTGYIHMALNLMNVVEITHEVDRLYSLLMPTSLIVLDSIDIEAELICLFSSNYCAMLVKKIKKLNS